MATKFLVTVLLIGVVCANVGARPLDKVSKELMDQKPVAFPPVPQLPIPPVPQLPIPSVPQLPIPPTPGREAAFVTKGGGLENGEVRVSKETKVGISIPKTVTSNGLGAELSVTVGTTAYGDVYSSSNAAAGPGDPSTDTYANGYGGTSGSVTADGNNAYAYSGSSANGQGSTNAAAGSGGAIGSGNGNGGASTYSYGETYD